MVASNVIDFVEVLQSRRARQGAEVMRAAGNGGSRLLRYRGGIDGLVTVRQPAKILPFEKREDRPSV